jgi:hypothetical protein
LNRLPLSATDTSWSRALGVMTVVAIGTLWLTVWLFDRREAMPASSP